MNPSGFGAFSVQDKITPAIGSTVAVNALTLDGGSVFPTVVLVAIAAVGDC